LFPYLFPIAKCSPLRPLNQYGVPGISTPNKTDIFVTANRPKNCSVLFCFFHFSNIMRQFSGVAAGTTGWAIIFCSLALNKLVKLATFP
jgi:hypothetical protein